MTNKARNIYIDTTGFCEDAVRRVDAAIERLIDRAHLRRFIMGDGTYFDGVVKAVDKDGFPFGRPSVCELQMYGDILNPRQVWLWELESLAGIR